MRFLGKSFVCFQAFVSAFDDDSFFFWFCAKHPECNILVTIWKQIKAAHFLKLNRLKCRLHEQLRSWPEAAHPLCDKNKYLVNVQGGAAKAVTIKEMRRCLLWRKKNYRYSLMLVKELWRFWMNFSLRRMSYMQTIHAIKAFQMIGKLIMESSD